MTVIIFTEHWYDVGYDTLPEDFVDEWYAGTKIPELLEEYDDFMVGVGDTLARNNMPHLDNVIDTVQTLTTFHAVQYTYAACSFENFLNEYEDFVSSAACYPFYAIQGACDELVHRQRQLHEKYAGILSDADPAGWCADALNDSVIQLQLLADDCMKKWQDIADVYEQMEQAKDDFYRAIVDGQCAQAANYLNECRDSVEASLA